MALHTSHGPDPSVVYSTPAEAVSVLVDHLLCRDVSPSAAGRGPFYGASLQATLWEPAAGSGAILRALARQLPHPWRPTKVVASDIWPRPVLTLPPGDFTKTRPRKPPAERPRAIVTNPPFSLATRFIETGLAWQERVPHGLLALFLPLASLAGRARAEIYAASPPTTILAIADRITLWPDDHDRGAERKGGVVEYCWMLWGNDADGAPRADAPGFLSATLPGRKKQ